MEKTLISNNNVPIYYYNNNHLHRFCITLYIKAGSMYEKNKNNGITHFWEHMIFRSINNFLNGELNKKIDKMGAYFNASTNKSYVEIKIIAATKYFDECAKIITTVFEPMNVTDEDFDIERKRIKAEIRESSEKTTMDYFTKKIIWKNTSLSNLITGEPKKLDLITIKKLKKFSSQILVPANMFFYVTGAFNQENVKNLKKMVDKYELQETEDIRDNIACVPKKFFNRNAKVKIKDEYRYCVVRFSFDLDLLKYKRAELDLLYDILFQNECSKIFDSLSEKTGLVYSFDADIEQYSNIGSLFFDFEVEEKNILKSIEIVISVFKKLKKGIKDELEYVKAPYTVNADMDLDEPEKLNWIMAYEGHILGQNYSSLQDRIDMYDNVSVERINKIINDIFVKDNMIVTLKTNKRKISKDDIKRIVNKL